MQERLIRATADPPPRDQLGSYPQAGARMVVIEAEDPGQVPIHRCRLPDPAPFASTITRRRGAQPGHEPGHVLHPCLVPARRGLLEELEPQLQADRVGPHRAGRALDGGQVGQVALGRALTTAPSSPSNVQDSRPLPGISTRSTSTPPPPARPACSGCLEGKAFKAAGGGALPMHAQRCDSNKACPQRQQAPNSASARSPTRSPGSARTCPAAWSNAPPAAALHGAGATPTPATSTAPTPRGSQGRSQDRHPHAQPCPALRYRPLFDNTKRLRELTSEPQMLSAEIVEQAEGWTSP